MLPYNKKSEKRDNKRKENSTRKGGLNEWRESLKVGERKRKKNMSGVGSRAWTSYNIF